MNVVKPGYRFVSNKDGKVRTAKCPVSESEGEPLWYCEEEPDHDAGYWFASEKWHSVARRGYDFDVPASTPVAPHDPVNSPSHYKGKGGFEAIDVIEAFELDYYLGNVIKYTLRAGKKGERSEDLNKAIWYLKRAIEKGGK